jgi:hypothetical protein
MAKKYWVIVGIVIVIAVLGIIYYKHRISNIKPVYSLAGQDKPLEFLFDPYSQGITINDTSTSSTSTVKSLPKTSVQYTKAVETYQYRIQFSECRGMINTASASQLAIAKGAKFMLDNRDPAAHIFSLKGQTVKVAGYGYAIITPNVLGSYPITCDGKNTFTLNVQ